MRHDGCEDCSFAFCTMLTSVRPSWLDARQARQTSGSVDTPRLTMTNILSRWCRVLQNVVDVLFLFWASKEFLLKFL